MSDADTLRLLQNLRREVDELKRQVDRSTVRYAGWLPRSCFGWELTGGAGAKLLAGEIQWGNGQVAALGEQAFDITADYQYVGLEFTPPTTVAFVGPNANVALFRSDDATFRCWLQQFRLIGGIAAHYLDGRGNIQIPGWFGG